MVIPETQRKNHTIFQSIASCFEATFIEKVRVVLEQADFRLAIFLCKRAVLFATYLD
jgi:hypothetical protein